ncbi:inositol monophosphatase family protein [Longispora sp. NPDC051575]|uniref:inositol monophosphatase family protein n=1 Tax=Longispora sp. NPDC051575 TaxID=3154943 RepID=UPI00343781DB
MTTTMDGPAVDRELLDFAVSVAGRAGALSAEMFFAGAPSTLKPDGTEVTDADLAVEDLIRAELGRYAPDDGILGEEAGESPGSSGRRWITDPISGTAYFSRRMPLFANLLAYEDEYGPAIGVINMPVQRELVFAARGLGCWVLAGPTDDVTAARRTRVGGRTRLDGALTLAMNQHTWSEELLVALHRRVAVVGAIHHVAVHLVTGRADAAVITGQGYDDLAPLPVILREAGGRVTDLDGAPVLTGDGSVLATNGALHGEFLGLVAGLPRAGRPKALSRE